MRAIGFTTHGDPDVLEVLDLPAPHPGPGQVRIRVSAAAVNPTDTVQRARPLQKAEPPWVPGMDVAGVVDEVGDDSPVEVGDRVMAIVVPDGAHGAYAEQVVVPAGSVVPLPDGVGETAASTLPMNALTAWLALDLLEIPRGGTVAVTGAAGAFGGYAVQLALARGLRVVADAADKDRALVSELGAHVVLPRGDGFAESVRGAVPEGVDGLADGSVQGDVLLPAVRDGGRIGTVRGHRGPEERGVTWHPVWVRTVAADRAALLAIRDLASSGALTPRVAGTWPAEKAADAQRALEAGGQRGRGVLLF